MGEKDSQRLTTLTITGPPLDAVRLAPGQTLYRLMNNRLGTLQMMWSTNPGSEGLTDHSPGGLMLHHPGHAQVIGTRQAMKCLSQSD